MVLGNVIINSKDQNSSDFNFHGTKDIKHWKKFNSIGTLYCLYYTLLKQGKNKGQKSSAKRHILIQYKKNNIQCDVNVSK